MARQWCWTIIRLSSILGQLIVSLPASMHAQAVLSPNEAFTRPVDAHITSICSQVAVPRPLRESLSLVCRRNRDPIPEAAARNVIVVGFVGGFVRGDDAKHPEVLFAAYLRERYLSTIHAEVFSNHEGKQALRWVRDLLDTNHDGRLTSAEREPWQIIIYGHSWGASQAIALARQLEHEKIPVLLTIQVDTIHKPGTSDSRIPANVENAVNFYQSRGLLHGREKVLPEDPLRTKIIGNFQMTYRHQRIDCSNYPRLVRIFNKPHHKIENDSRVWDQIASLIDSKLSAADPRNMK